MFFQNLVHDKTLLSKVASWLSVWTLSSSTTVHDLWLNYDKTHHEIWDYYFSDDFDLICFPADKSSLLTSDTDVEKI